MRQWITVSLQAGVPVVDETAKNYVVALSRKSGLAVVEIQKPLYGKPCNGCGMCCDIPCPAITVLHPGEHIAGLPCPRLRLDDKRYNCGLLMEESDQLRKEFISLGTGQNWGCDHVRSEADWERRKRLGPPRVKRGTLRRVNELINILGIQNASSGAANTILLWESVNHPLPVFHSFLPQAFRSENFRDLLDREFIPDVTMRQ